MILQPVLHPLLLLLLCTPVAVGLTLALVRDRGRRALWALRLILLLACIVLLLRPGIPGGSTQTLATDTDVILVVDTTASIVAEDWDGDEQRLEGVRADIADIVAQYPGARFALITFDAAAELRLPLTTDTTALASSLEVMTPEVTGQSQGSSVGLAHTMLAETLQSAAATSPDRGRMVFYFGDGEQTAATDPESFAESAEYVDAGSVLGYGTTEGGPMRETTGGVGAGGGEYIEYQGEPALSVRDEATLQTIADELGVPLQLRSAEEPLALPDAPTTTSNFADSGEVGNVTELYWIAAIVIALLLAFEITRATMLIARMRGLALRDPASSDLPTGGAS
ncbi:MAG: VWA domain-containing protein [Actinomycetota bacterium]